MTSRLKSKDDENENESDWKFAAMVIDRLDTCQKLKLRALLDISD